MMRNHSGSTLALFSRPARLVAASLFAAAVLVPAMLWALDFKNLDSPVSTSTYVSLTSLPQGGMAHVAVEIRIKDSWHINAHDLKDEFLIPTEVTFSPPQGITIKEVVYPAGHAKKLDFAEEEMLLYDGTLLIGAIIEVAPDVPLGEVTIPATLTYQACDNLKCLLPREEKLYIITRVSTSRESVDLTHAEIFASIDFTGAGISGEGATRGLGSALAGRGWFLGFILVFLGGLALNLTPCVFPIIPITVSYFGGQTGGQARTTLLAILYLLGMATMYSTLGLVAAVTGNLFGAALQNPFVNGFIALVMIALALSMFGFYEIRVPARLAGVAGTAKQGAAGAFLMGLTVGIVAAPCIGPFVIGLLTFVGERGDPVLGFSLFFALAVGLGSPYVVLAVASGNISRLPRSGEWMEWVRRLFGVILVGMAVYFLNPILGDAAWYLLLGGVCIVGGIMMGFVVKAGSPVLLVSVLRRFTGIVAPLYGLYLILAPGHIIGAGTGHGIAWQAYDDDLLVAAKQSGQPVLIDFSAEWCLPCQELDHETFSQPRVIEAAKAVVPLRADLTRSADEEVKELRERYEIRGVPTVVFIDAHGLEREDLRIIQFVDADEFLDRLAKLTGEPVPQVDARVR